MNTTLRNFCAALSLCSAVSVSNVCHAAIIQYEVTGTMWFVNPDWSNYTIAPLSGYLNISDVNTAGSGYGIFFDIPSFTLHSEGFERAIFNESGTGYLSGTADRNIRLNSDDWQYIAGSVAASWMEPPESWSWDGQGWIYGPEYYYKIATFSIQAIGAVPIPAAAWLLGSGLLGLVGVSLKRRRC